MLAAADVAFDATDTILNTDNFIRQLQQIGQPIAPFNATDFTGSEVYNPAQNSHEPTLDGTFYPSGGSAVPTFDLCGSDGDISELPVPLPGSIPKGSRPARGIRGVISDDNAKSNGNSVLAAGLGAILASPAAGMGAQALKDTTDLTLQSNQLNFETEQNQLNRQQQLTLQSNQYQYNSELSSQNYQQNLGLQNNQYSNSVAFYNMTTTNAANAYAAAGLPSYLAYGGSAAKTPMPSAYTQALPSGEMDTSHLAGNPTSTTYVMNSGGSNSGYGNLE